MLKKIGVAIILLIVLFFVYALYSNRNAPQMTTRQKILKTIYPAFMWVNKLTAQSHKAPKKSSPLTSFYQLHVKLIDGTDFPFEQLKDKKILLVNTASDCGYTGQLSELQQVQNKYADKLVVIGFPSNDFKEQEKGSNKEIAEFCKRNYGVSFLMTEKIKVTEGQNQHPVYNWLTQSNLNGWNNKLPNWNFAKYLVNEKGMLTHYFEPGISPLSSTIESALNETN